MSINHTELATELNTDPVALGYAPHLAAGAYTPILNLLNAVRAGATIFRGVIPSHEIIGATDPDEWTALTAAEKQRYQTITGAGSVDTNNANARAAFLKMFTVAAGPVTRAALIALASRPATRAEELFGANTVVALDDVILALRGSL